MHVPTTVEQYIYLEEGQRQSLSITCCSGCSTTTTEVTDKIQNSTTVDNSWSFVNLPPLDHYHSSGDIDHDNHSMDPL